MADLTLLKNELKKFTSTLKDTSKDKQNNEYLCQSIKEVYSFDDYKNEFYPDKKSFDALCIENDAIYCIEFKNQECSEIKNQIIQGKFNDGLDILEKIFIKFDINKKSYPIYFFVVFKDVDSKSFNYFRTQLEKQPIKFGLEKCKAKINDFELKIITNSKSYFIRKFNISC